MTQQVNIQKNLRALYKFDSEWFDGDDLIDLSVNRNHATASGGVVVDTESPYGGASKFDGTDDSFIVPGDDLVSTTLTNVFGPSQSFSLTVVYRTSSNGVIFYPGADYEVDFGVASNSAVLSWYDGTSVSSVTSSADEVDKEWHVTTFIVDGPANEQQIWTDSNVVANNELTYDPNSISDISRIGSKNGDTYFSEEMEYDTEFTGQMAYLAVHTRVLREAEIKALHEMKGPMVQRL